MEEDGKNGMSFLDLKWLSHINTEKFLRILDQLERVAEILEENISRMLYLFSVQKKTYPATIERIELSAGLSIYFVVISNELSTNVKPVHMSAEWAGATLSEASTFPLQFRSNLHRVFNVLNTNHLLEIDHLAESKK